MAPQVKNSSERIPSQDFETFDSFIAACSTRDDFSCVRSNWSVDFWNAIPVNWISRKNTKDERNVKTWKCNVVPYRKVDSTRNNNPNNIGEKTLSSFQETEYSSLWGKRLWKLELVMRENPDSDGTFEQAYVRETRPTYTGRVTHVQVMLTMPAYVRSRSNFPRAPRVYRHPG